MDHRGRTPLRRGHVQGIEHQFGAQVRRHRPADHAATPHIEDDGQIEETRPGRDVGDIRHPEPIRPDQFEMKKTEAAKPAAPEGTVVLAQ